MVDQISDFKMPEKIVARLLKESLPEDVILSKDAQNAACRSACIFILQLSITAAEKAQMRNSRLDARNIIDAASELGLSEYAPLLVRFAAQRKRNATRKETKAKSKRSSAISDSQHQSHYQAPQHDTSTESQDRPMVMDED